MGKKSLIKFIGLVLFLLIVLYIFNFTELGGNLKSADGRVMVEQELSGFIDSFGVISPIIFILIYAILVAFLFPATILTFIGAALFGIKGFIFNLIGASIGASLSFLIARGLGKDFVEKIFKNKKLYANLENNGFNTIFILRLIPIIPFNVLDYIAGITKIKFKDYFFATLIGMMPGAFIYTYLFAILSDKVLFGKISFNDLIRKEILIPIILFILLVVLPVIFKNKIKKMLKTTKS